MEVSNMVTKMGILFRMFVFIGVFSGYNAHHTVKVVVPSQDWHTAAVGSDYTAHCESDSRVIWRKRGNEDVHLEGQITEEDNKYVNKLVLMNITYRFVGFYECLLLNGTSDVNASFYLYVDDPVHLILAPSYIEVHSKSYQPAVVPCRPTAPDVFVKLLTSKRDRMANSVTRSPGPEERNIYFDSQRGFIMPAHLMQTAWFIYICEFSKRGVIQEMKVDLFTMAHLDVSDNIAQDIVGDTRGNILAKPGDTVVLPVEVFTEGRPNNIWEVRRANGQVIELAKSGVINERSNKIRVEETDGYPWETKVVIHDVNKNDEGAYTLKSYTKSGLHHVSTMFHVNVGEATGELSMEIAKVVKVHDYRSIHALCLRKADERKYNVKWSFRPLDCADQAEASCEESVSTIDPLNIDERPSVGVLSAAVLELPRLGNLNCTIHFDDGSVESVTKPVVLSEVEDGFEVRKLSEEVDEPSTVTLQCVVSKYLYSDHMYWIAPEGHVIEDCIVSDTGDFTKLTKSENEFSYILELGIKHLTRSHGNYRCMAVNNDHKPEFKTYSMNIPVPVLPQFYANLDNNTLLIPSTSTVTLSCDSDGIQTSATLWLKDDIIIGRTNMTLLEINNVTSKDSGKYTCELSNSTGSEFTFTQLFVYDYEARNSSDLKECIIERNKESMLNCSGFGANGQMVFVENYLQGSITWGKDEIAQFMKEEPDATNNEDVDEEEENGLKVHTLHLKATLHCHQYGKSSSKMEWYKNGEKLPESAQRTIHDDGSVLIIHQVHAKDAGLYSCKPEETDTYTDDRIVGLPEQTHTNTDDYIITLD